MLFNNKTITEVIGDVDPLYNAVWDINIMRYIPKEYIYVTKH